MPLDSEPMHSGPEPDDLSSILVDIVSRTQFKFIGLLLIMFLIVSSDVFTMRVLSKFDGAVDYKTPTSWGTFQQGLWLCLFMVISDVLIRTNVI